MNGIILLGGLAIAIWAAWAAFVGYFSKKSDPEIGKKPGLFEVFAGLFGVLTAWSVIWTDYQKDVHDIVHPIEVRQASLGRFAAHAENKDHDAMMRQYTNWIDRIYQFHTIDTNIRENFSPEIANVFFDHQNAGSQKVIHNQFSGADHHIGNIRKCVDDDKMEDTVCQLQFSHIIRRNKFVGEKMPAFKDTLTFWAWLL